MLPRISSLGLVAAEPADVTNNISERSGPNYKCLGREEHPPHFSAILTEVMNKPDYPWPLLRALQATLKNTPACKCEGKMIYISFHRIAAPRSGRISAVYKCVFPAWCVFIWYGDPSFNQLKRDCSQCFGEAGALDEAGGEPEPPQALEMLMLALAKRAKSLRDDVWHSVAL